jgi:hypothetical protein
MYQLPVAVEPEIKSHIVKGTGFKALKAHPAVSIPLKAGLKYGCFETKYILCLACDG